MLRYGVNAYFYLVILGSNNGMTKWQGMCHDLLLVIGHSA